MQRCGPGGSPGSGSKVEVHCRGQWAGTARPTVSRGAEADNPVPNKHNLFLFACYFS